MVFLSTRKLDQRPPINVMRWQKYQKHKENENGKIRLKSKVSNTLCYSSEF